MYRRPSKRFQTIQRILTYVFMVVSVLLLVGVVLLFVQGYQLGGQNGLEQGALLQFNTQPTGGTVTIDGKTISGHTPNKSTVLAGTHSVTISKDGYQPWTKKVSLSAGTLTWLDYGLLIPTKLPVKTITTTATLAGELASPDQNTIIMQPVSTTASFRLVDLRSDTPKITTIDLPQTAYSEATTVGITHSFRMDSWDANGRYVLVQHNYDGKSEWIVFDTQNPSDSKNVTTLLAVNPTELRFSGTSGNVLFGLVDGSIRKFDLSGLTLSRPLASNVTSFDVYDTNTIVYVGTVPATATAPVKDVVGVYEDGDDQAYVLRTVDSTDGLHIATTRYFNNSYIAISTSKSVEVLEGAYPHSSADISKLQKFATFTAVDTVQGLSFSPDGTYVMAQSGATFASYDLEHQNTFQGTVTGGSVDHPLRWLNQATLYADVNNELTLREFDGANFHAINPVATGFDATLTSNDKYLYSVNKDTNGSYVLQRVLLTLN